MSTSNTAVLDIEKATEIKVFQIGDIGLALPRTELEAYWPTNVTWCLPDTDVHVAQQSKDLHAVNKIYIIEWSISSIKNGIYKKIEVKDGMGVFQRVSE